MAKESRMSRGATLHVQRRHWMSFVAGGVIVVSAWIFIPSVFNPYVRLQSSTLSFHLDCVPSKVTVYLRTALPAPQSAAVRIVARNGAAGPVSVPVQAVLLPKQPGFDIDPTSDGSGLLAQAAGSFSTGSRTLYTVAFDGVPSIDVEQIDVSKSPNPGADCDRQVYAGGNLRKRLDDPAAQVMVYRILQEEVGDLLFRFNSIFANVVLGGMLIGLLWFIYILVVQFRRLHLDSDDKLLGALEKRKRAALPALQALGSIKLVEAEFVELNRRLGFAKTMGPALGFLLTVSSLSAALHPSAEAPQDTYRLISGIQLAVVATFVGLAIRIITHYAQRVHRDLTERQLDLLVAPGSSEASTHAAEQP